MSPFAGEILLKLTAASGEKGRSGCGSNRAIHHGGKNMKRQSIVIIVVCVLCALSAGLVAAQPAAPTADAVVQPPCDEAAFVAAFNAVNNGTLTFNCGGPATISFSSQKTLPAGKNVTIDGANLVKLSGGIWRRLFVVDAGAALTLTNITITRGGGEFGAGPGGAIQTAATLIVTNSRFVSNATGASYGGGAIYSYGAVVIDSSVFESNSAGAGGAIYTEKAVGFPGTLVISNSQFISNTSVNYYGGGIANLGWLTMTNALVQGNQDQATATAGHGGAGLANYEAGIAALNNITFS
jgi:predicted outer membrane repeat protein